MQLFNGRRAVTVENGAIAVVVLEGGGHIAAVVDKATGVNPLWVPPWPSIEPSAFGPGDHALYGSGSDGRLLAGIMGHNLCLDLFGGPSPEEEAAGITAHGEASVATYNFEPSGSGLTARTELPVAQLRIARHIELDGRFVRVRERVENLCGTDRPIGWTQHVTLGPPSLELGSTEFRASATESCVIESQVGSADYLRPGARFEWPEAPAATGGTVDLRLFTASSPSSAYTAHLMNGNDHRAFFVAFSPRLRLAFGCVWNTADFPWMGIWEENHSRSHSPWNSRTLTRGMEFGVSPFPESRRDMVDRGRLFGVPTYRWLPARGVLEADYAIVCRAADTVPEELVAPV
jgi:hypothetical protein